MPDNPPISHRTLDLFPALGEMLKPVELIDVIGAGALTLADRQLYNALVAHAFGPDMGIVGREFVIPTSELRGAHKGLERVEASIVALMRTIVVIRLQDGGTRRVALLGGNDIRDSTRTPGYLRYSFDQKLVPILRDSRIFGKLELRVMQGMTSRHGLALYESLSLRINLRSMCSEELPIDKLRVVLGVEDGTLERFADLRRFALEPAVRDVNQLAPFSVHYEPVRNGKRYAAVRLAWFRKTAEEYRAALRELDRPRVGRRARARGNAEHIIEDDLLNP